MTRVEILAAVRGLKAGDAIVINDWERPMKVCAVSDRYALAYNENDEYTIISKEPVEHQYNGIMPGAIVCAADWWTFGYKDGYRFNDPAWVKEYMRSLESGETETSMRHREEIRSLRVFETVRMEHGGGKMQRGLDSIVGNPCVKDCPGRTATCHTECEKYARYSAWCAEQRKKRAEDRAVNEVTTHGMRRAMAIKRYREKYGE